MTKETNVDVELHVEGGHSGVGGLQLVPQFAYLSWL